MTTTTLSSINSQYVDSLAGREEPGWLAAMRKQAFSQYESLPAEVSPLYSKYSDVNKIKPTSVHLANAQQPRPANLSKDLNDRLKELEQENAKLKRLLAEAELDKAALKDLLHRKL